MTSKELNEILNKTRKTPNIYFTEEQVKKMIIDLEEYERLKELMGTPIQELMKKLKELEEVKEFVVDRTAFYDTGCCLDEYIYYDTNIGTIFLKWSKE